MPSNNLSRDSSSSTIVSHRSAGKLPKNIGDCIVDSFKQDRSLNTLDLGDGKKITDAELEELCEALKNTALGSYITKLRLGINPITDKGMQALAGFLPKTSVLKSLDLGNTQCTDEGIVIVLESLTRNTNLTELNLGTPRS